jgi:hypothetical protein
MATYVYWGFKCKTENCPAGFHPARYIGKRSEQAPIIPLPDGIGEWFDFECGYCGAVHRYMRREMELVLGDEQPPSWFVPWF